MYQEVCFNRGTELIASTELMRATRSAPSVILCLLRACSEKDVKGITLLERKTVVLGRINLRSEQIKEPIVPREMGFRFCGITIGQHQQVNR